MQNSFIEDIQCSRWKLVNGNENQRSYIVDKMR